MQARIGNKTLLIRCVVLCLSIALTTAAVAATDDITVGVSLDRNTIGLDEQALLQVQVSGRPYSAQYCIH